MIHELIVDAELSCKELKKLSRRLAMTGGYELILKEGMSQGELEAIAEIHLAELTGYTPGESRYRSNNSFRILNLLLAHKELPDALRKRVVELLAISG
jgi:hypothetical protein